MPAFLAGLAEATGQPIEVEALLPPLEADIAMETFRTGYQSATQPGIGNYRRFFRSSERDTVFDLAVCLAGQLSREAVLFLTKLGADSCAVNLEASVLLTHAASVIRFDGDSLSALSVDRTQGILIDHNPDDLEQTYEIAAWGDRWSPLVLYCDQE